MAMTLDALTVKIQRILGEWLDDVRVGTDGSFLIPVGSTVVIVRPQEVSPENTAVVVFGLLNRNVPATPAFYEWIAKNTDGFLFGHLGIEMNDDGATANTVFSHTLLGDCLDPEELKWTVGAVASSADDLDDEIQDRFGGERWTDTFD